MGMLPQKAAQPWQIVAILENRSAEPAIYLVVGTRAGRGVVHYPDHDVVMVHDAGGRSFTRSDGTAIPTAGRKAGA